MGTARFVNHSGENNARLEDIGVRMQVRVRREVYILCDSTNMILFRLHKVLDKGKKYLSLILLRMWTKQARLYLETSSKTNNTYTNSSNVLPMSVVLKIS